MTISVTFGTFGKVSALSAKFRPKFRPNVRPKLPNFGRISLFRPNLLISAEIAECSVSAENYGRIFGLGQNWKCSFGRTLPCLIGRQRVANLSDPSLGMGGSQTIRCGTERERDLYSPLSFSLSFFPFFPISSSSSSFAASPSHFSTGDNCNFSI